MTDLERAILHIKTRADAWAVKEIEKALLQEPCADAVSREDAITAISQAFSWVVPSHPSKEVREILNKCKENLRELPSVTHKSGKWEDLHRCWVCSECGQQTHIEHKYCPNCGCRMESEE